MAFDFATLPRAAQRAAFAKMGSEDAEEGGPPPTGRTNRTSKNLGAGTRHHDLTGKANDRRRQRRTRRTEVEGGTPEQRELVERMIPELGRDFPPDFANRLKGVVITDGAAAHYNAFSKRIFISSEAVDDHSRGAQWHVRSEAAGFKTPSGIESPLQRTLTHEFGHFVDLEQRDPGKRERMLEEVGDALGFAPRDENEALSVWVRRNSDQVTNNAGSYASTNTEELVAELWTEYAGRRDDARLAARIVGQHFLEWFGR